MIKYYTLATEQPSLHELKATDLFTHPTGIIRSEDELVPVTEIPDNLHIYAVLWNPVTILGGKKLWNVDMTDSNKFAKKCDCCGEGFNHGFLDDGDYYCSEKCLLGANNKRLGNPEKPYTMEDWEKDVEDCPDECYYSEWDASENDGTYFDADGREYDAETEKMCAPDAAKDLLTEIMEREANGDADVDRDSIELIAETENSYIVKYCEVGNGFLNIIDKEYKVVATKELTLPL